MDKIKMFLTILAACCVIVHGGGTSRLNKMMDLHETLLSNYSSYIRPCLDCDGPLEVNLALYLSSLNGVDEVKGEINTAGMLYTYWYDERLTWDPNDYTGIENVVFPTDKVWIPPIMGANPSFKVNNLHAESNFVRVHSTGYVRWWPGDVFRTTCEFNVYKFPYDKHTCDLLFLPKAYVTDDVILNTRNDTIIDPFIIEDSEWELSGNSSSTFVSNNISIAKFSLTLQRRSLFIQTFIIYPVVVLNFLNCIAYLIPTESSEQISYCITVLLSFLVFMTLLNDNIPKSSKPMPVLCNYLIFSFSASGGILLTVVFAVLLFHRDPNCPVPKWCTLLLVYQRRLYCKVCDRSKVFDVELGVSIHRTGHIDTLLRAISSQSAIDSYEVQYTVNRSENGGNGLQDTANSSDNSGYELQATSNHSNNAIIELQDRASHSYKGGNELQVRANRSDNGGIELQDRANHSDNGGNELQDKVNQSDNGGNELKDTANQSENDSNEIQDTANQSEIGGNELNDTANQSDSGVYERRETDNQSKNGDNEVHERSYQSDNGGIEIQNTANQSDNGGNELQDTENQSENGDNEVHERAFQSDNGGNELHDTENQSDNGGNELQDTENQSDNGGVELQGIENVDIATEVPADQTRTADTVGDSNTEQTNNVQWKDVAQAVDKLFLILSILFQSCLVIGFYFSMI